MMRSLSVVVAALAASTVLAQVPAPKPAEATVAPIAGAKPAAKPKKPVYDEVADARADVAAALQKARRENRRVLIQWGANWCHWCTLLAERMRSDREVARKLMYEYDVVKIDVGQFDKNIDLAKDLGVELKAIPFLTILGTDGKPIVQQPTEPFETQETKSEDGKVAPAGHDGKKLLAFLTEHQAAYRAADDVLAAGLAKAKADGKRVFLHFGAPWCPWCHQLDDWMRESAVEALLGQDFVDVKIDTDRMTGGEELLAAQRATAGVKASGIPWVVLLGADGAQLTTSDGPDGNIGFPAKDEEIAWFGQMLGTARANLKDADIDALKALLVAWRTAKGLGH